MRFEGIEFPRPLLNAQEEGTLAIFAGAGVSMPAPSSHPDFNSLANLLANGTGVLKAEESADRFLGKLDPALNIHERTRALLSAPDSQPNSLHHDLLKIFSISSAVRLVTTNFDDHFASAATEVFVGGLPEMFFAPALPVGGDFAGIVHLHGSVRQDPKRMVLTDKDFGRAYLTEGWARRFVLDLFLNYTVLFIGYSHNDPVMQYLARGLPPGDLSKRRYAFGLENSKASWDNLGIQLLPYSRRNASNEHIQLQVACTKWSERVRATPLQSREQIRRIVEKPPQPAGEEIDLIEKALEDPVLVKFYVEFASGLDWLQWVSGREAFKRILTNFAAATECDQELGFWFAQRFAVQHPGAALDLIRRNSSYIPPLLWSRIAWTLWQSQKTEGSSAALHKWVPLLLANQPLHAQSFLEYILADCRVPENETAALLLLRHLLRPTVTLREGFRLRSSEGEGEPVVSIELGTRGDPTFVSLGWQHLKNLGLAPYADHLLTMATFHLEEATALFRLYEMEFTGWDPITSSLSKVDTPSITLSHSGLSILIDIARETLRWIIANVPERSPEIIRNWSNAQSLTLRRLAAYGVTLTDLWSANEKVAWLKDDLGLFEPGFSAEISQILDVAFPSASPQNREPIVRAVIDGPGPRIEDDRVRDGIVLGMLVKLDELVPDNKLTLEAIQKIRHRRPEFAQPVTDDERPVSFLPSWERLPFSVASLLGRPASESTEELLSFTQQEEDGPDRSDVIRVVREATQENPDWGFQLSEELCTRQSFNSDLWPAIIAGLSGAEHPNYPRIVDILSDHPGIAFTASDETASFLEKATSQEAHGIESAGLSRALEVGLEAWEALRARPWLRKEAEEWLTVAINDTAGILLRVVIRGLVNLKKQKGETWNGLPPGWNRFFSSLVNGKSWSDAMGRIILAAQVQLLFWLDPQWTNSALLPIFDWTIDPLRAQQAWHGYLVWGNWSDDFLEHFLSVYVQTFEHLSEIGKFRREFCQHLAGIAVFSSVDPLRNGWLKQFVIAAAEQDRYTWTASIAEMLKQVPEGQIKEVWGRWLRSYWLGRLQGIPRLLSGEETTALAHWPMQLPDDFAEAVHLLLKSPDPVPKNEYQFAFLLMRLQELPIGIEQPNALAQLVLFFLKAAKRLEAVDSVRILVLRLIATDAEVDVLLAICERLAALGFSVEAAHLKKRILGDNV